MAYFLLRFSERNANTMCTTFVKGIIMSTRFARKMWIMTST